MNQEALVKWKNYFNQNNSQRIKEIFDYNLSNSKNLRALFMTQGKDVYNYIAICLELLQSYFLITDDIMDNSVLRRGKLCWYKKVGYKAIKDAYFLLSLIFKTINEHERISGEKLEHKNEIIKSFFEANFYTCLGQTEDTVKKELNNYNDILDTYTSEKYERIVKYKTSYYTTYLPLKLRYILNNCSFTQEVHNFAFLLGYFMQVQDDFLNFCPETSGKSGTDVEEKKVTYYSCKLIKSIDDVIACEYFIKSNFEFIKPYFLSLIQNYDKEEEELYNQLLFYKDLEEFDFIMKIVYKRRK
ncbi:hypothetical protein H311_01872 [Anncaliia algerae PRA109]|nr:hypothetical protein H311_01872 [Anncaliia algerae PRA109]